MSLYRWWKKERPMRKSLLDRKNVKRPAYKTEKVPDKVRGTGSSRTEKNMPLTIGY